MKPELARLTDQVESPALKRIDKSQNIPTESFLYALVQLKRGRQLEEIEVFSSRRAIDLLRNLKSRQEIEWLRKRGSFLRKWERSRRATLPLALRLETVSRLSHSFLLYMRSQFRLRLVEGRRQDATQEKKDEGFEVRKRSLEEILEDFRYFEREHSNKKVVYRVEQVGIGKVQKSTDASEHLKIRVEEMESLKKVERYLEEYI